MTPPPDVTHDITHDVTRYATQADLGGLDGFGAIVPEPEGELFHATWEARAMALTVAMGATGSWNIDTSRAMRETLPDYRELSYYQIWIGGLERLLVQRGLVLSQELAAGQMQVPAAQVARVLTADRVTATLTKGSPASRPTTHSARFTLGQRVRTVDTPVLHHTRLPGYARGKRGVVQRLHGPHVFADANAQGLGEQPQWLYTVVFDAAELWGAAAAGADSVSIDAFEPYLESV